MSLARSRAPFGLLFLVIFLEGFAVLASELIAIRLTIPFIGSGTDTVSIIIAAVLMPLAFGYYYGGQFSAKSKSKIRQKLVFNLLVSLIILVPGLSYYFLVHFFQILNDAGLTDRIIQISLYSLVFLSFPVFLLGQTIPLVSNYFSREKLSQITGKILFLSTLGSFMGAVFTTLVLMTYIGVHHTASIVFGVLLTLLLLLVKNKLDEKIIFATVIAAAGVLMNSDGIMTAFNIVDNNRYNTIMVFEDDEGNRSLSLNHNDSSKLGVNGDPHEYIKFVEERFIEPAIENGRTLNNLVIGAGGFTLGLNDTQNQYDFIDIDGALKEISEEYFLEQELSENKIFHALPARGYLNTSKDKYDLILLDAYLGATTLPEHLVTEEFFTQVKEHLAPGGIIASNFIISADFKTKLSVRVDNTLRAVFGPYLVRHIIGDFNPWSDVIIDGTNVMYVYFDHAKSLPANTYTDNKNTVFLDRNRGF